MSRNGCRKILIVNGHGGNKGLLNYFGQIQLEKPRDYVVYSYGEGSTSSAPERPKTPPNSDGHAGISETSRTMITRPELVRMDRVASESGADRKRQDLPKGAFTGIFWYASYPDHYAGDGAGANRELGEIDMKAWIASLANVIRSIKADEVSPRLQREFFEKSAHPLDTKQ
jgi:creatinine amidohydrolase